MASMFLLAAFLLCSSFPVGAQDTRTDQAGSVLREYVDKGYCTYTYVVPPGSRTGGCTPPGLESQLAETKEETGRLKNQVDRLSSLVEALMTRADSLAAELSAERVRSAQLVRNLQEQETKVQNLTRDLQEQETRLTEKVQEQETRVQNLTRDLQEQETRVQDLTRDLQEQETRLTEKVQEQETRVQNLAGDLQEQETRVQNLAGDLQEQETRLQVQCCSATAAPRVSLPAATAAEPTSGVAQASDCADLYAAGQTTSGVYNIRLNSSDVETYCDMDTAGGGWTVIQRRQDGSVRFDRTWEEYKHGFGNKSGEYWLGNENIHLLTSQKNYTLRVDLEDWEEETRYATYAIFRVSGESDQYELTISGYSGDAGDSMAGDHTLNGQRFSTVDRDNDVHSSLHCSQALGQAGWWFGICSWSNLNGRYLGNCKSSCPTWQGVLWNTWIDLRYSLKSVSMKIKP